MMADYYEIVPQVIQKLFPLFCLKAKQSTKYFLMLYAPEKKSDGFSLKRGQHFNLYVFLYFWLSLFFKALLFCIISLD